MAIKRSLMLVCLASLVLQAGCNEDKVSLQITGIVYDAKTNQPIDKAYVIAIYSRARGTFGGHSSSYCYMARGMYTGPDGKFALPVTNLDNGSPREVHAIKADYYFHDFVVPENIDVKRRPKEFFSNRHIYLMPQDPAKPEFRFSGGDEYCNGTTSKADAGAIIPFQQIAIEEVKKYGGPSDMIAGREGLVSRLVDLPSQAIEKDVKGQNK